MTKRYRLKIEYPGSHPVGTISKLDYSRYPEVWEEIKEEAYVVLSFLYKSGQTVTLREKGTYIISSAEDSIYVGFTLEQQLRDSCRINSVKRLSDGEIFTLGDTINFDNVGAGELLGLEISKDSKELLFITDNPHIKHAWDISQLNKTTVEPLFKTEDGLEIFKYNHPKLYWVNSDFIQGVAKENSLWSLEKRKSKYFTSETDAKEYIKMNKPAFSRAQIINMLEALNI